MSIASNVDSILGNKSRRAFLQGMGAVGATLLSQGAWAAITSESAKRSAARAGKKISLLNDGEFQKSAWGWQFTSGARIADAVRHRGHPTVQVKTDSGDYARFFVLGPEAGKSYTLSGWVKSEAVVQEEENAGVYFAASQFEFQGRPTEFTVDGKQLPEQRFGNFTGTTGWRRFSQTFTCLPTTTWFEVAVGIYRAAGTAWFSDLTFVEGDQPADIEEIVDAWQALQWAHEDNLRKDSRIKPAAAIFNDLIPVRGAASDPKQLARIVGEIYDITFLTADQLADPALLNRANFDLLILPYGESFPLPARDTVQAFLADGGDLLSTGGYAFQSPLIRKNGRWEFYDQAVERESGPNLLPDFDTEGTDWKAVGTNHADRVDAELPGLGKQKAARIEVPANIWAQSAEWRFDLPAQGYGDQYFFQGWIRASSIQPAPHGAAYIGIEQLDETGAKAYAASLIFEKIRGTEDWHRVERLIFLIPTCRTLRIRFGLENATGTVWGAQFHLEKRSPQVCINTALGFPQDELRISPGQIGIFDADFRLQHVAAIRPAKEQSILHEPGDESGAFEGYAATCVVGMNNARWIPLLESQDALGRKRGSAGAFVYHTRSNYARGSWAFFGVDNQDIFSAGKPLGEHTLRAVSRTQARKCFLHECETNFASYRDGEPVQIRVLVSNFGRQRASLEFHWRITEAGNDQEVFRLSHNIELAPGQTEPIESNWRPASFSAALYRITVQLFSAGEEIDQIETGFVAWKRETLQMGLAFEFKNNYFQVNGKSLFLQGTDDYLHTFIDQDENPLTWYGDAQGCHDTCIDVYENLMGLRGPQQRPTEAWWRWIDAMLSNVQRAGGAFFPGMLIFSNTAVSNRDMADQEAYVQAFAARYKDAAGIMYYLNGDLELHDPNLPDLQKLYNQYLQEKYGSDEALRKAWSITPPESPIGKLAIRSGSDDWRDVRTLDDYEFRTRVVSRWLNAMHDAIRKVDRKHPVTAEFYQYPGGGIDLLSALGKLELANFGYFNSAEEDYYRFPQVCKFLDQSIRGKGVNVGEFGVKTHPAWLACDEYIGARTEQYEQAYFLALAHYAFALGASKIQNWCWKYPSDLPFEWGINYSNELIPRNVRAFYRNSGILFRQLRPRYESSETLVLLAGENRKGGAGSAVLEGISNGIRLLIDERVRLSTLSDEFIDSIPDSVKTIFYPLPYCPSDTIVGWLTRFVESGGQLYLSGDISYDPQRQRSRTQRLKNLCGVEFIAERFPNITYQDGALRTLPKDQAWPEYVAAPGIIVRLAGATSLMDAADGSPIVTEYQHGKGKVIFSADPIELHGDPRYHPYAHRFYGALLDRFHIAGEKVVPAEALLHRFCVPSQDDRRIDVLVNYDDAHAIHQVTVPIEDGDVQLSLAPRMPGIIVSMPGKGVQAIESSGDVLVNGQLLIGSDLHLMAIALEKLSLPAAKQLLLLPMGQGNIRIPKAGRWRHPIVLTGEVTGAQWRQYESFVPEERGGVLYIPIQADRALSMLIVCESEESAEATHQIEVLVNSPWDLK